MRYVLLIGSHARGDADSRSDCDILLINATEESFDHSKLPIQDGSLVNYVIFDQDKFERLYKSGSLFLLHAFSEGQLLEGSIEVWNQLKGKFTVQKDYREELLEIAQVTALLANTKIFGGKYLTPLVNAFTELKNACIFFLAHDGIYVFNKSQCFDLAIGRMKGDFQMKNLKDFYDYSVRGLDVALPFDPNNEEASEALLLSANSMVKEMSNACMQ